MHLLARPQGVTIQSNDSMATGFCRNWVFKNFLVIALILRDPVARLGVLSQPAIPKTIITRFMGVRHFRNTVNSSYTSFTIQDVQ